MPLSGNVSYFKGTENTLKQRASDKDEYSHKEPIFNFFLFLKSWLNLFHVNSAFCLL